MDDTFDVHGKLLCRDREGSGSGSGSGEGESHHDRRFDALPDHLVPGESFPMVSLSLKYEEVYFAIMLYCID